METVRDRNARLAEHLEGISRRGIEAVNNRQWNHLADPWIHYSRGHIYDPQWRNDLRATMQGQEHDGSEREPLQPTGHNFVDFERSIVQISPEFHVHILNVDTTVLDEEAEHATVMVEAEETGVPPGVTRPCMAALNFRKLDGKWLCTMLRSVAGVDLSSSSGG
ncbi:hypothetical protein PRZ48_009121 [Zasmidium cellare]|uniref:SnoaL-like domain-containing protein n=1 Tax=Zasmidium cellare TaxID=395010 RepID=A0ABR0EHE0_ZASCE|nr:hypothetical protein PRZ48_009121 [Zasmidium cellare]